MAYERVNGTWPKSVPALTDREAITAAKRLYRFAMKKPFVGTVKIVGRLRGASVRLYGREMILCPKRFGWHGLVHSLSHRCHRRLHPRLPDHCTQHAFLEREMIEYVVRSGWLDGKLRRPEKPKVPIDVRALRHARVIARMKVWEAKRKRAETALKKLRRQKAYYDTRPAAVGQ